MAPGLHTVGAAEVKLGPCQVAVIRAFTWISPGLSTAIALQYRLSTSGTPQLVQPLPIVDQDTIH